MEPVKTKEVSYEIISSEYANKFNLFVADEFQLYLKKRQSENKIIYKCRVQKCNAQVVLENHRCYRKINGYKHNHPEVSAEKIAELKTLDALRKKVIEMPCGRANWKNILEEFELQHPNIKDIGKSFIRSLQRLRKQPNRKQP